MREASAAVKAQVRDDDALKAELWEIAENLHRCDLTKEQRDEHIRRYAELLANIPEPQLAAPEIGYKKPPPAKKGIARQIADATGLSDDTIRRALNPKPIAEVIPIAARSEQDAVLAQANAIVAAWNRACPAAREIARDQIDGPVIDRTQAWPWFAASLVSIIVVVGMCNLTVNLRRQRWGVLRMTGNR